MFGVLGGEGQVEEDILQHAAVGSENDLTEDNAAQAAADKEDVDCAASGEIRAARRIGTAVTVGRGRCVNEIICNNRIEQNKSVAVFHTLSRLHPKLSLSQFPLN